MSSPVWWMSGERRFCIEGEVGTIELLVNGVDNPRAVALLLHPHPLHGGSMDNKVVHTLARACRDSGIVAVRMNFRGVGQSAGSHDDGQGERVDARTVHAWLQASLPQGMPFLLGGFSFGAAIAASLARDVVCRLLILIAPPVPRYGLMDIQRLPGPVLVVQGGADEVVDPDEVEAWVRGLQASGMYYEHWDGVGHFFHGALPRLRERVMEGIAASLV